MIELKLYRHKEYKDCFLVRSNICGGNWETQFYDVTDSVLDAIRSLEIHGDEFMFWLKSFPNNKTTTYLSKEMEFDGYKGILRKKLELNIADFELVTLKEAAE